MLAAFSLKEEPSLPHKNNVYLADSDQHPNWLRYVNLNSNKIFQFK